MGRRAGQLSEVSRRDAADISAGGMEIFPYEHSIPPSGMKNVEMRMRRRNYVIDFSNFQVNISMNVKFENNHVNAREIFQLEFPFKKCDLHCHRCAQYCLAVSNVFLLFETLKTARKT